jgi:hypothetical protein
MTWKDVTLIPNRRSFQGPDLGMIERTFFSLACTCVFNHVHELNDVANLLYENFKLHLGSSSNGHEFDDVPNESIVLCTYEFHEVGHPVTFGLDPNPDPFVLKGKAHDIALANNNLVNRHFLIIDDPFEEMKTSSLTDSKSMVQSFYIETGAYEELDLPNIEKFLNLLHGPLISWGSIDPQNLESVSRKEQYCFRIKRRGDWTRYVYRRYRETPSMLSLTKIGFKDVRGTIPVSFPYEEDRDVEEWPLKVVDGQTFQIDSDCKWTTSPRRYVLPDDLVIAERVEDDPSYIIAWNTVRLWILNYYFSHVCSGDDKTRLSHVLEIEDFLREHDFPVPSIPGGWSSDVALQELNKLRTSFS